MGDLDRNSQHGGRFSYMAMTSTSHRIHEKRLTFLVSL